MKESVDIIGMKFGRLTVLEKTSDKKRDAYLYKCVCDCQRNKSGNEVQYTYATHSSLVLGCTKSCGCLKRDATIQRNKESIKTNSYTDNNDGTITGECANGTFLIDKESLSLVIPYCWRLNHDGYIETHIRESHVRLFQHRLIYGIDAISKNMRIDHINGNRADNRKSNLRLVTLSQNAMNRKIPNNNTSGCSGVSYNKIQQRWEARIGYEGRRIHLGWFDTLEEAVMARKKAEEMYYGEYARKE